MIKSLSDLAVELNKIYPTRYSHFANKQQMPFITYITTDEDNTFADNKVYAEGINVDVELYTETKDLQAERAIKNLLNVNEIPYNMSGSVFIDEENAFMHSFSIKLNY